MAARLAVRSFFPLFCLHFAGISASLDLPFLPVPSSRISTLAFTDLSLYYRYMIEGWLTHICRCLPVSLFILLPIPQLLI